MAKTESKRVVRLSAGSWATFVGTFAAVIGLGIAIIYSLDTTIDVAEATDSVLSGMAFGLAAGVVSILVLPLLYFAIGWVIGYVQGWVYNAVLGASGGIVFDVKDE